MQLGLLPIALVSALLVPRVAAACSCGGRLSPDAAFLAAERIVVAEVVSVQDLSEKQSGRNADGSYWGSAASSGAQRAVLRLRQHLSGPMDSLLIMQSGGTSCSHMFRQGEQWLIYAAGAADALRAGKCTRSRVARSAAEEIRYLSARRRGEPISLVFGEVQVLVRDSTNAAQRQSIAEPFMVVIGGDSMQRRVVTAPYGEFEIAVPPGRYRVWVARGDRPVSTIVEVVAQNQRESRVALLVPESR